MRLEREKKVTILDEYDCTLMDEPDRLRILIDSTRDPILSDIMSELHDSDGHLHFDGFYMTYNGIYHIDVDDQGRWYLDLYIE